MIYKPNTSYRHCKTVHNGQIEARREAPHVILGSALVFLGVIGSFKLIGLYRTETVCFRAGLTIFTTLICSFCVYKVFLFYILSPKRQKVKISAVTDSEGKVKDEIYVNVFFDLLLQNSLAVTLP